jgi:hypothetical protein
MALAEIPAPKCEWFGEFACGVLVWRWERWHRPLPTHNFASSNRAFEHLGEGAVVHVPNRYRREPWLLIFKRNLSRVELLGSKLNLSAIHHAQKLLCRDILRQRWPSFLNLS